MAKKKTKTKTKTRARAKTQSKSPEIKSVVAKSDDGTIQITFTIPYSIVDKNWKIAAKELAADIEIPGFRKGNAPLDKAIEKIPHDTLIQKTLGMILPREFGDVVDREKLKPAVYPRFELIKAKDGEPWEVRGVTCELPEIELGDYKKLITGEAKVSKIWTPGSDAKAGKSDDSDQAEDPRMDRQKKEQVVIKALLDNVKVTIPKILVEEEVNNKLSQLLARIEKLGLQLESYLASVGKTPDGLRKEYEEQAKASLTLDLILNKVAKEENIQVDSKAVDGALQARNADPNLKDKVPSDQERRLIESILVRKAALDSLVALL